MHHRGSVAAFWTSVTHHSLPVCCVYCHSGLHLWQSKHDTEMSFCIKLAGSVKLNLSEQDKHHEYCFCSSPPFISLSLFLPPQLFISGTTRFLSLPWISFHPRHTFWSFAHFVPTPCLFLTLSTSGHFAVMDEGEKHWLNYYINGQRCTDWFSLSRIKHSLVCETSDTDMRWFTFPKVSSWEIKNEMLHCVKMKRDTYNEWVTHKPWHKCSLSHLLMLKGLNLV